MELFPPEPKAALPMRYFLLPATTALRDAELFVLQAVASLSLADCARDYGLPPPTVSLVSRAADIPADGAAVTLQPTIDVPQDDAYHSLTADGRPYAIVLAPPGTSVNDIFLRTIHELKEGLVDPFVDWFVKLKSGNFILKEVCDGWQAKRVVYTIDGVDYVAAAHVPPSWWTEEPIIDPGGYATIVSPQGAVRLVGEGPAAEKNHPAMRFGKQQVAAHKLAMQIRLGLAA